MISFEGSAKDFVLGDFMKLNLLITTSFIQVFGFLSPALAATKEIALMFDDAPGETTLHFAPAQVVKEKTGNYRPSYDFNELKKSLNQAMGLK